MAGGRLAPSTSSSPRWQVRCTALRRLPSAHPPRPAQALTACSSVGWPSLRRSAARCGWQTTAPGCYREWPEGCARNAASLPPAQGEQRAAAGWGSRVRRKPPQAAAAGRRRADPRTCAPLPAAGSAAAIVSRRGAGTAGRGTGECVRARPLGRPAQTRSLRSGGTPGRLRAAATGCETREAAAATGRAAGVRIIWRCRSPRRL